MPRLLRKAPLNTHNGSSSPFLCAQRCVLLLIGILIGSYVRMLSNLLQNTATTNSPSGHLGQRSGVAHSPGNRTLVILLGSLRVGEPGWETLYENVLDVNHADVAVLTEEKMQPEYQQGSLLQRAKHVWRIPHYTDWADAMNQVMGGSAEWRKELYSYYDPSNIMLGGMNGIPASGAIVFYLRWKLGQLLQENGLLDQYDRFMVTRSDQVYVCPLHLDKLDNRFVWSPVGEDYHGINDRFVIANSSAIIKVLDTLTPLLQNPSHYKELLGRKGYNSEQFLLHRWTEDGIPIHRFPRTMFTGAAARDVARWRQPYPATAGGFGKKGIHLKYMEEYNTALWTCGYRMEMIKTKLYQVLFFYSHYKMRQGLPKELGGKGVKGTT